MINILDELYDCNLFHLTRITDVGDRYRKAMERLLKAETELLKAYPDCRELLDNINRRKSTSLLSQTAMSSARVFGWERSLFLKCSSRSSDKTQ